MDDALAFARCNKDGRGYERREERIFAIFACSVRGHKGSCDLSVCVMLLFDLPFEVNCPLCVVQVFSYSFDLRSARKEESREWENCAQIEKKRKKKRKKYELHSINYFTSRTTVKLKQRNTDWAPLCKCCDNKVLGSLSTWSLYNKERTIAALLQVEKIDLGQILQYCVNSEQVFLKLGQIKSVLKTSH